MLQLDPVSFILMGDSHDHAWPKTMSDMETHLIMDQIIALLSGAIFISLIICGFGVKKIGLYRPEIFIARDWEFDHVPNAFYFLFRFLWCSLMWNTAYHSRCKLRAFKNEKSSHIQHKENNFSSKVEYSVQMFCGNLQVVHLSNTISSERLSLQKAKSRLEVFFQVHNITEFVAKIFSKLDSKTQNLMVVQYCTKLLSTPVHMMLVLNTMNSWPPRAAMFDHCSTWTGHYCSWFGTVFPNLQRTLKYLGYVAQLG